MRSTHALLLAGATVPAIIAPAVTARPAAAEDLLPPISPAADGTPAGWHVEDWQRPEVQVQDEKTPDLQGAHRTDYTPLQGDVTFIRLRQAKKGNTFAYKDVPVEPSWREVRLSAWVRLKGLSRGDAGWKTARVSLHPDGDGSKGPTHSLDKDTDEWQRIELRHPLATGTKTIRVSAGLLYSDGTLDFARPVLVGLTQQALDAERAAMRLVKPADPSRVTGAKVDETKIKRTLVVDQGHPAASDAAGAGTAAKPFKTFGPD
jgi:hypothetical protein